MSIIQLKNIYKSYNENVVLEDFNLTVKKGELISIVGDSGSGKSTLLNIIGLLESPDKGEVIINGIKNVKPSSKNAVILQRYTIGYLFQNYALVDNLTVNQNLDIALRYSECKNNSKIKLDILKDLGLKNKTESKIYQLSGGEQQRVAIARLMLKPCEIILADEPTGSLDKANADAVIKLLKELNKQGKTVLIVTHDSKISDCCNRVIRLRPN